MTNTAFDRDLFAEWIVAKGGSVLAATNEWEVIRYRTAENATGVVYKNKKDALSFTDRSGADYRQMLRETDTAPNERQLRKRADWSREQKAALLLRDGPCCAYCNQFVGTDENPATLEHFHALSTTGGNHLDNLALACEGCNVIVGDKPVIAKLRLRDRIQAAIAKLAPWEKFDARKHLGDAA